VRAWIINPPWETPKGFGARSNCRWPHVETTRFTHFPIYLGYTAGMISRAGIDTAVLDCAAENITPLRMLKRLEEQPGDIYLLETSTPSIFQDLDNVRLIKEKLGGKLILMGPHVSVFDETILEENPAVDAVIRGEFEEAALALCTRDWSEIAGITYRINGGIVKNPDRTRLLDLDDLPFPAWDKFDLSFYDWALLPSPALLTVATRGCPFQCNYCLWPEVMYGRKQRRRSPGNIAEEIRWLIRQVGMRGLRFDDDTFALNSSYVASVCEEMIKNGFHTKIQWSCFGHTSMVDAELFTLMKAAGCVQIDFGVETGSGEVLADIGKATHIENTRKAVETCRRLGIKTYGTYMIGFPEETEADIAKTMRLALELNTDFMQVSFVIPYPGTRLFKECRQKGYLPYGDDWAKYDATVPVIINKVPAEVLMKLYRKFWFRYFVRPRYGGYFVSKSIQSPKDFLKALHGVAYVLKKLIP